MLTHDTQQPLPVQKKMKNIIFDFGNVLVQWEPERVYDAYFGSEARSRHFLAHVCDAAWRSRIDAGESQDACIAELAARHPHYAEAIALYRDRWAEMLTGEMPGMRQLLGVLKESGVEIYGLTNWSMETFPQARERFGILQMVERYVVSGAEGMVKPDARLFGVLLDRYGLRADECLFVDDNEANVQAARQLGMEGIVFGNAVQLRRELGLYRPLTCAEVEQLERQGNECRNWLRVKVAEGADLSQLWHNRFKHDVEIGLDVSIQHSYLSDCAVADGTEIDSCRRIDNMRIGCGCRLTNVGEISFNPEGVELAVMNENGGRAVKPADGMRVGDAYLAARFRDRDAVLRRIDGFGRARQGVIGDRCTVRNATAFVDGLTGDDCLLEHGVIAERFILGDNVKLEAGLRLNDSVVGDNSTLARGEVGNSLIFPAHEQHHNNSFLIAALVQGQSNVAAGCTLGSNHNGRTADGELSAGRGFWPGLCVSVKHSSRMASYTLMAKGDYPSELNITLPFALVNNNASLDRLEVMPAYWWLYNMYALNRNITKFAARDRRRKKRQHVEFSPFAPDTAEELLVGRGLLHLWTTKAYQEGQSEVTAYGMERGHRKVVILKPGDGYKAYGEMLVYYAMSRLTARYDALPPASLGEGARVQRWVNLGGQLLQGPDADALLDDIERGRLASWDGVHRRLDDLWAAYDDHCVRHAYQVLCELNQTKTLSAADYARYQAEYVRVCQLVRDRIASSRAKDAANEFRQTTFWNTAEMRAVMGE